MPIRWHVGCRAPLIRHRSRVSWVLVLCIMRSSTAAIGTLGWFVWNECSLMSHMSHLRWDSYRSWWFQRMAHCAPAYVYIHIYAYLFLSCAHPPTVPSVLVLVTDTLWNFQSHYGWSVLIHMQFFDITINRLCILVTCWTVTYNLIMSTLLMTFYKANEHVRTCFCCTITDWSDPSRCCLKSYVFVCIQSGDPYFYCALKLLSCLKFVCNVMCRTFKTISF